MKKILALAACAALLAACDQAQDVIDDLTEPPPDPVAFASLTLTTSPLPPDEDGSAPDLYVEIQDAGGNAIFESQSVLEDAEPSDFPYVLGGGELVGAARTYALVVLDRDADGYDRIASAGGFTADDLRESPSDTFAVTNAVGTLRAELALAR